MSVLSLIVRRRLVLVLLLSACFFACNQGPDKTEIVQLEQSYQTLLEANGPSSQREEMLVLSQQLADTYEAYVKSNPKDPESVEFLYKASEHLENPLNKPEKAIEVLDKIASEFPEHPRAADAMFRKGYIYHNTLQDLDKAKIAYNEFIEKYPDHQLIPSAKFEVEFLGIPTDELLERLPVNAEKSDNDSVLSE